MMIDAVTFCCPMKGRPSGLAVLFLCAPLFGQSAPPAKQLKTFHISGTITEHGRVRPGHVVTFDGQSSKSVGANDAGFYEADLPVGLWTVTATVPHLDPTGKAENLTLARPRLFRVTAPTNLVLNIFELQAGGCTIRIITPDGRPPTSEERDQTKAFCAGEEFFPVPSSDGVPFEVRIGGLNHGPCTNVNNGACNREFATYNLLSMQADRVVYHPDDRILEASGDVVIEDESGEHKAQSITLYILEGHAIPIQNESLTRSGDHTNNRE